VNDDDDVAAELDPERLALLRDLDDGDGTLLATLAEEFVAGAGRQLESLHAAIAEGDPQVVERAAHNLKGSSSNLGAARLSEIAAHLESLGRARALGSAGDAFAELTTEFDRVRVALAALESVQ
jgi:HPt (histidine-containing phosphotransfer) domain-containing protein